FSTDGNCREYGGGALDIGPEFPCIFVPARPASDRTHVDKLLALLAAAEGKWSQGNGARNSDLAIVASALESDAFQLRSSVAAGVVLLSTGRTYDGAAGDSWPYLRQGTYAQGQSRVRAAFERPALDNFHIVFGLSELTELPFQRL